MGGGGGASLMSGDRIQGQPREDRKGERSPEGQCLVLKSEMNAPPARRLGDTWSGSYLGSRKPHTRKIT